MTESQVFRQLLNSESKNMHDAVQCRSIPNANNTKELQTKELSENGVKYFEEYSFKNESNKIKVQDIKATFQIENYIRDLIQTIPDHDQSKAITYIRNSQKERLNELQYELNGS